MATDQSARMTQTLYSADETVPVQAQASSTGSDDPASALGATDVTEGQTDA